jgi:hypothetical protein
MKYPTRADMLALLKERERSAKAPQLKAAAPQGHSTMCFAVVAPR